MKRLLVLLILTLLVPGTAWPAFAPGAVAVVADDGNNLRQWGGANYAAAPVLGVLGKGVPVTVVRQQGRWAEVTTQGNLHGWVNAACLVPLRRYLTDPANRRDVICPKDYRRRFTASLAPGEPPARITLQDVPTLYGGGGRLLVADASGRPLWRGPIGNLLLDDPNGTPLFFFCSPVGVYWPSVIGDVDGDGRAELLATGPQSDVSVSSYTVARWNGQAFVVARQGRSLVETPMGSGRFAWVSWPGDFRDARWVMNVTGLAPDGTVTGEVYEYGPDLPPRVGTARLRFDRQGATLVDWVTPLRGGN